MDSTLFPALVEAFELFSVQQWLHGQDVPTTARALLDYPINGDVIKDRLGNGPLLERIVKIYKNNPKV